MSGRVVRIATRGSALALAQSRLVAERLLAHHPEIQAEPVVVETRGDQQRRRPLWKLEGYGFFTTQVEAALLDGRADMAVHSYKDMPTLTDSRLTTAAIFERLHPEDAAAAAGEVHSLEELAPGMRIGTSSPRRIAQIKALRPDLEVRPLRGNVQTRLETVRRGEFDAVIVARAGLERLGLADRAAFYFDPTVFIPAAAQGALAIQIRSDDSAMRRLVACLHDGPTAIAVRAERAVLTALHPGCHAPVGVYARLVDDAIEITAMAASLDGASCLRRCIRGSQDKAAALAAELVEQLRSDGVAAIIKPFEDQR